MQQEKELSTFELNPVMWLGILGSALALAVAFGATITEGQVAAIMDFAEKFLPAIPIIVALVARRFVFPTAKVEAAVGTTEARRIAGTTTKALSLLIVCMLGVGSLACATRADGTKLSPEATIAYRGTALVNAIGEASPLIERLADPNTCGNRACLTAGEALQIAEGVRAALVQAKQLPPILLTVDKATTAAERQQGLGKARAAIDEVTKSINAGMILPQLPDARVKVVAILQTVQIALIALGGF